MSIKNTHDQTIIYELYEKLWWCNTVTEVRAYYYKALRSNPKIYTTIPLKNLPQH